MKTDELIALLASRADPVRPRQVHLRFLGVLAAGAGVVLLAMLAVLGPRADLATAAGSGMFWWKLAFPGAVAACAFVGLRRLGYPGTPLGVIPRLAAAPFALVWAGSAAMLASSLPAQRASLLLGSSGPMCSVLIVALSVPASAAALFAVRALAPTRPCFTGAFAGLLAGACAAFVYALHCTEMQLPFLGAWYALGMVVPAVAAAACGARMLRC